MLGIGVLNDLIVACHVIHVEALGALQKLRDLLAEDERVDAHTAQCCLVVPVIPQMSIEQASRWGALVLLNDNTVSIRGSRLHL